MHASFISTAVFLLASIGLTTMAVTAAPSSPIANTTVTPLAAPFGINYGQTWNNDVAWVDGQSKCNFVVVGPLGANPCGRTFTINGQSGFTFEGCGGSLWINKNGNFYANCGGLSEGDDCGVHSEFHCI